MARSSSFEIPSGISNRRSPSPEIVIGLERDVPVLSRRDRLAFGGQHAQGLDQPRPCLGGLDHVVDEPALRGSVWGRELLAVLADQLPAAPLRIRRLLDLLAEDD